MEKRSEKEIMFYACTEGRARTVDQLLKKNPSLSSARIKQYGYTHTVDGSSKDYTPLHWASYFGHIEVVEVLLAYNADPNKKNKDGEKPGESFDRYLKSEPEQKIQQLLNEKRNEEERKRDYIRRRAGEFISRN